MRAWASVLVLVVAVLGTDCSSVRTQYDFDPSADFSAWRTYAWYPSGSPPTGDPRLNNPLLHRRIEAAVNRKLGARDSTQVQEGTPDFYVNYHLSTEHVVSMAKRTSSSAWQGRCRSLPAGQDRHQGTPVSRAGRCRRANEFYYRSASTQSNARCSR